MAPVLSHLRVLVWWFPGVSSWRWRGPGQRGRTWGTIPHQRRWAFHSAPWGRNWPVPRWGLTQFRSRTETPPGEHKRSSRHLPTDQRFPGGDGNRWTCHTGLGCTDCWPPVPEPGVWQAGSCTFPASWSGQVRKCDTGQKSERWDHVRSPSIPRRLAANSSLRFTLPVQGDFTHLYRFTAKKFKSTIVTSPGIWHPPARFGAMWGHWPWFSLYCPLEYIDKADQLRLMWQTTLKTFSNFSNALFMVNYFTSV